MSVQYLVDFENVHETGLRGLKDLPAEDNVYILHTATTDRIALSSLDGAAAWVKVILVPPGKQSLDMHLVSLLGYLIGKEDNPDTQYVIISKDNDYLGVSTFWNQSCSQSEKVNCAGSICSGMKAAKQDCVPLTFDCTSQERTSIREFIVDSFGRYGSMGRNGLPCMRVSELCAKLNELAIYSEARNRTGKKPLLFLRQEFGDIIQIAWEQDWAYLIDGQDAVGPVDASFLENAKPGISDLPQTEDEPDVMETEIPSVDDLPDLHENSDEENSIERQHSPSVETDPVQATFLSTALDLIKSGDNGRVRASALRDMLLGYPDFRLASKNSGMKPIAFIQHLFEGEIEISRDRGIYWACVAADPDDKPAADENRTAVSERESVIEKRKQDFFQKAFDSLMTRLMNAGVDRALAEEIANIYIHSNISGESRKAIHTLLCQRFGNKLGSKYYRQALKYF